MQKLQNTEQWILLKIQCRTVTGLLSPRKSCNLNVIISVCMELITDCIISKYTFGQWSPNKRRETNYKSIYYGVIHLLENLMLGMLYTTGRIYTLN